MNKRAERLQTDEDDLVRAAARDVRVGAKGRADSGDCHRISVLYSPQEAYRAWHFALFIAGYSATDVQLPRSACFKGMRDGGYP